MFKRTVQFLGERMGEGLYQQTIWYGGMILYAIYLVFSVPTTADIDRFLKAAFVPPAPFTIAFLFAIYALVSFTLYILHVNKRDKEYLWVLVLAFITIAVAVFICYHELHSMGGLHLLFMFLFLNIQDGIYRHFKKRYEGKTDPSFPDEKGKDDTKRIDRITSSIIKPVSGRCYNGTVFLGCMVVFLLSSRTSLKTTWADMMHPAVFPPTLFIVVMSVVYIALATAIYYLQIKEKYRMLVGFFVVLVLVFTAVKLLLHASASLPAMIFIGHMKEALYLQGFLYLLFWIKIRWKIGEKE